MQVCNNCVMDTTDPEINFNSDGVCSYCTTFPEYKRRYVPPDVASGKALERLCREIKQANVNGNEYDCLIGLSGGADSSYMAYLVKKMGLKPLAVHFDSGWNSELAVQNIEKIVKSLDLDLVTHVCDWEEMSDLQLSFFKASLVNCDIPQDHAFVSVLYETAAKFGLKYVLSGHNFATESVLPRKWGYTSDDLLHLKAVHKRFGRKKLKKYPMQGFITRFFYYPFVKKIKIIRFLNYTEYHKEQAMDLLTQELGWRKYAAKHYESIFTRFNQGYYLAEKFHFDKRKAHLSSLILNGYITRDQAIKELAKPLYNPKDLEEDLEFVAKKLKITPQGFAAIIAQPPRAHEELPSHARLFTLGVKVKRLFYRLLKGQGAKPGVEIEASTS
ncbi:MAG: N-acetyl sugar amidotransferase [Bdellovibrionales bacterium]|nr:N-acetyl sugar amidotransferase [Bdellovibrionales bacterium]